MGTRLQLLLANVNSERKPKFAQNYISARK